MWICFITSTFELNSWEVMRLYRQRYSGWAVVTVVSHCSSNLNQLGWSSNKIRGLHIRYTIWRTYTIRLAVALLVEHRHTIPVCFRGFLLFGMFMSDQRWSSCCPLSDGKGRILPHTRYRVCPFWTIRCDSCYGKLHGILRMNNEHGNSSPLLHSSSCGRLVCGDAQAHPSRWTVSIARCNCRWSINSQFKCHSDTAAVRRTSTS